MTHNTVIQTASGLYKKRPYVKQYGGQLGLLQNPITKENPYLFPPTAFPPKRGSRYHR